MYPTHSNMKKRVARSITVDRKKVGIAFFHGRAFIVTKEQYRTADNERYENEAEMLQKYDGQQLLTAYKKSDGAG